MRVWLSNSGHRGKERSRGDIKKEDEAPDNASGDVATKLAYQ